VSGKYDYTKLRKALDEGMSIVHGETVLLLLADLDAANTNLHTALVAMRSARDERDKYEEEAHAANARADEAEACDSCASMGDLQERLADALANRDLWRKRAIHIAGAAAEASNPMHFATVDGVAESTAMHLASAMYSLDDGTLFLYPANALAAAREAVRHE